MRRDHERAAGEGRHSPKPEVESARTVRDGSRHERSPSYCPFTQDETYDHTAYDRAKAMVRNRKLWHTKETLE